MKKKSLLWISALLLMLAGCSSDEIAINDRNILGYWELVGENVWGTGGLVFSSNGEIKSWNYGIHSADDSGPRTYSEGHWGYFWFDDEGTLNIKGGAKDSTPHPDELYFKVMSLTEEFLVIRVYGGIAGTPFENGDDMVFRRMPFVPCED